MNPALTRSRYLAPGDRLGKYDLIRQIAVGGMAEIYLARTVGIEGFEKLVVVKRILPQYADNASFVNMFLNEARLAATLHHPNIAQVYDIGQEQGDYFFSMEYVHGEDLGCMVASATDSGVPLSLDAALTLVAGLCAGLNYAHEKAGPDGRPLNVVHRDVSPSNVLVSYDGAVKLVDFGIARAGSQPSTTRGGIKGKIGYMSPEQCRGGQALDRRSDVFSIGAILFELTTGRLPFTDETEYGVLNQIVNTDVQPPTTYVPTYPPALEAIVMKALARNPDARYGSALQLQGDIEDFAHDNRLRVSPLVLARLMGTLFPARLEEWDHARAQGAFFVEQHVVRTLIESGKTSDSAPAYPLPPPGNGSSFEEDTSISPPPQGNFVDNDPTSVHTPAPGSLRAPSPGRGAVPPMAVNAPRPATPLPRQPTPTVQQVVPPVHHSPVPAVPPRPGPQQQPQHPQHHMAQPAPPRILPHVQHGMPLPSVLQGRPTAQPQARPTPQPRPAVEPQHAHQPTPPPLGPPPQATPTQPPQAMAPRQLTPAPQPRPTPVPPEHLHAHAPAGPTPMPARTLTPVPGMPQQVPGAGTLVSNLTPAAGAPTMAHVGDVTERVRVPLTEMGLAKQETALVTLPKRSKLPIVMLAAAGVIGLVIATVIVFSGGKDPSQPSASERAVDPAETASPEPPTAPVEHAAAVEPPPEPAKPIEPASTEPASAEPASTEPASTEPASTEPAEPPVEETVVVKADPPQRPTIAPKRPKAEPKAGKAKPKKARPRPRPRPRPKKPRTRPAPKPEPKEPTWNADSPFMPVRESK